LLALFAHYSPGQKRYPNEHMAYPRGARFDGQGSFKGICDRLSVEPNSDIVGVRITSVFPKGLPPHPQEIGLTQHISGVPMQEEIYTLESIDRDSL
jgi:hypothetical protein